MPNVEILISATKSNGVGVGGETEAGEHKACLPTWKTIGTTSTSLNPWNHLNHLSLWDSTPQVPLAPLKLLHNLLEPHQAPQHLLYIFIKSGKIVPNSDCFLILILKFELQSQNHLLWEPKFHFLAAWVESRCNALVARWKWKLNFVMKVKALFSGSLCGELLVARWKWKLFFMKVKVLFSGSLVGEPLVARCCQNNLLLAIQCTHTQITIHSARSSKWLQI